jgi:hypothetical protein
VLPTYHSSLLLLSLKYQNNNVSSPALDWQLTDRSKPIIAVVFYSTFGHIEKLAEGIIKGVEATGAEVRPYVL